VERERCRVLNLPDPPTEVKVLQRQLSEARDAELEMHRALWLDLDEKEIRFAEDFHPEGWEEQITSAMVVTDLFQMLVNAAADQRYPPAMDDRAETEA
jgi:hypothetical protein